MELREHSQSFLVNQSDKASDYLTNIPAYIYVNFLDFLRSKTIIEYSFMKRNYPKITRTTCSLPQSLVIYYLAHIMKVILHPGA
jgi:hypothetical protein